jgi:hypothetical protein
MQEDRMNRKALWVFVISACLILANEASGLDQASFKIPYKFEAAGKKLPAGTYGIGTKDDGQLVIRQEEKGIEVLLPVLQRMPQPTPPVAEPQVTLDVVGNFEPSYTEYVTDYILSEVWFPGQDGFLLRALKGAHKHETIRAESKDR